MKRRSWLLSLVDSEEEDAGGSEWSGRQSPECVKVDVGAASSMFTEKESKVESNYVYLWWFLVHSSGSLLSRL